jgi:transposase InsO family protein
VGRSRRNSCSPARAGKQKRISLGTYPEVTLREARSLRDEARALIANGINPRVHRKQKRTAVRLADENIFERVRVA